ncbi:hypothetical protein M9Y10_008589 [Tritrichomonas musculus]|uniref:Initiator binding domain-containing protein n=1 Tax=Tritrichomonas musculus TaxID=1915356 RepID=A0ABR2IYI4_9EUKA
MPRNNKIQDSCNPRYFELLTEDEKLEYSKLREQLSSPNYKNRRNKSNEVFRDMVDSIKQFAVRNDENDWKRSLVCGIIWLQQSIAINTHQLRLLITKCKSSINGSFQALGYGTVPTVADSASELISKYPFLRHNFSELRQWTVRQKLNTPSNEKQLRKEKVSTPSDTNIISPPPDIIQIIPNEYRENQLFSLSVPPQPLFDLISENSISLDPSSTIIQNYLNLNLNLEESDSFLKATLIDDYDTILPKPTHNFENDPLIFLPNMNF